MAKNSVDGTTYMLNLVEGALGAQQGRLAQLQSCTELDIDVSYGKAETVGTGRHARRVRPTHRVTLKASDTYTTDYSDGENFTFEGTTGYVLPDGTKGFKSFSDERKSRVSVVERNIANIESDIKFLKTKIAEFKEVA